MKTLNDYLKEVGLEPKKSSWDCQGKTIVSHKALETIATHLKIGFGQPEIIESRPLDRIVVIVVAGSIPIEDGKYRSEWSFGEASPDNIQTGTHKYGDKAGQPKYNAYPYAMAEKRAKDRVILKLLGLHGEVYSEEEAVDFKQPVKKEYSRMDSKMDAPKGVDLDDIFS
jgi:hypothetical protein